MLEPCYDHRNLASHTSPLVRDAREAYFAHVADWLAGEAVFVCDSDHGGREDDDEMAFRINLSMNPAELLRKSQRAEKKIAFGTVNALNNAAKNLQSRIRGEGTRDLTIRGEFARRQAAIIKPFASVKDKRPYAELSVGKRERLLLPELATKEPEKRKPFTPGAKRVAIPLIDGQPRARFPQKLPKELYWKALRLKRWPRGTAKGARKKYPGESQAKQTIWRGRLRTYMIPSIGVFQRKSSSVSEPIYLFDADVPIPQRLGFLEIMERHGSEELTEEMEKQMIKELARGL